MLPVGIDVEGNRYQACSHSKQNSGNDEKLRGYAEALFFLFLDIGLGVDPLFNFVKTPSIDCDLAPPYFAGLILSTVGSIARAATGAGAFAVSTSILVTPGMLLADRSRDL